MSATVGQPAPEFALYSNDKELIKLSDLKGQNVVLLFFPLAFTGVCTREMCMMRDDIAKYQNLNATVLGVSVDSVFTLDKFKAENHLNFPLLSDFNKTASVDYGAYYEEFAFGMKGVSRRAAFVIDADGILRHAEVLESAGELPNFYAVEKTLAELRNA